MADKVGVTSTKNELLKAYTELMKKYQEEKNTDRKAEKKKNEETEIVARAEELAPEAIITGIANLKLSVGKFFDEIEEKLVAESKLLDEVKQAVEIEKRNLNEIHEISVNADSLAVLLRAQEEEKEQFEESMGKEREEFEEEILQKKAAWKKEAEDTELSIRERKVRIEKERKQEEEDFLYNLTKKRKIDEDVYLARKLSLEKELSDKKALFEKEIAERQKEILEHEKEFKELKSKAEAHPKALENAILETEKKVRESIEVSYKHQADLLTREMDGERKLSVQNIASLETKIKEKDELIRQLTQKVNDSGKQVQDIALKAIEGASRPTVIREMAEKTVDQGKFENRNR